MKVNLSSLALVDLQTLTYVIKKPKPNSDLMTNLQDYRDLNRARSVVGVFGCHTLCCTSHRQVFSQLAIGQLFALVWQCQTSPMIDFGLTLTRSPLLSCYRVKQLNHALQGFFDPSSRGAMWVRHRYYRLTSHQTLTPRADSVSWVCH